MENNFEAKIKEVFHDPPEISFDEKMWAANKGGGCSSLFDATTILPYAATEAALSYKIVTGV